MQLYTIMKCARHQRVTTKRGGSAVKSRTDHRYGGNRVNRYGWEKKSGV